MPKTALLTLENVTKTYPTSAGDLHVLKGVSVSFYEGETVALVGKSGSGKSTFLHIAGLLDAPTSGEIKIGKSAVNHKKDKELSAIRNQTFGFVYQHHHLLKEFTVLENVLIPAQLLGRVTPAVQARALMLLEAVGLAKRQDHLPSQLSGGEAQRVALARALMNKPKLLLADEPTGNLDEKTAKTVTDFLFKLVKEEGLSLLLVTHSQVLAKKCARTLQMKDGVIV